MLRLIQPKISDMITLIRSSHYAIIRGGEYNRKIMYPDSITNYRNTHLEYIYTGLTGTPDHHHQILYPVNKNSIIELDNGTIFWLRILPSVKNYYLVESSSDASTLVNNGDTIQDLRSSCQLKFHSEDSHGYQVVTKSDNTNGTFLPWKNWISTSYLVNHNGCLTQFAIMI